MRGRNDLVGDAQSLLATLTVTPGAFSTLAPWQLALLSVRHTLVMTDAGGPSPAVLRACASRLEEAAHDAERSQPDVACVLSEGAVVLWLAVDDQPRAVDAALAVLSFAAPDGTPQRRVLARLGARTLADLRHRVQLSVA
ncbi:MAG: hypothetical protein H3C62_01025 [Gemmatimonadaceae bacterium]|nr:hypothetical protein [Gemmatimonadaceae bacterium]